MVVHPVIVHVSLKRMMKGWPCQLANWLEGQDDVEIRQGADAGQANDSVDWHDQRVSSVQLLKVLLVPCFVLLSMVFMFSEAHTLPQFTRQYELKCSKCHLAPPTLNFAGRRFLQNGYRFFREERDDKTIKDLIKLDRTIPLGAWFSSQPYERKNGVTRIRPFNDARLYLGGGLYRDVSAFMRLDLDQAKDYRFGSQLATLSYNPTDLLNAHVSWTSVTFHDINDTLHSSRQLTLMPNAVLRQSFGGADNGGSIASPRQGLHFSGWLTDQVFYTLGYTGNADDFNIGELSTLSGRLAFEILPVSGYDSFAISVGAFGMHGFNKDSKRREFDRLIGDVQMDIPLIHAPAPGVIRLMGAYLLAKDDRELGGSVHNRAWYVQALFAAMSKGDPTWVPVVRFDEYTQNDGRDRFRELTLNLTYYFVENFRAHLEHWRQIDVPAGSATDRNVILRFVYLY